MTKRLILASSISDSFDKLKTYLPQPLHTQKIIAITTASNPYPPEKRGYLERDAQPLLDTGARLIPYDIANKPYDEVADFLADAGIIYVTGGNSFYLLEHMRKCDFGAVLQSCLERGAVYVGSSAGAVVVCPNIDYIDAMDDRGAAYLHDATGLNLVNFKLVPHFDHERYHEIAQGIYDRYNNDGSDIIGLNDNQVVIVEGTHVCVI